MNCRKCSYPNLPMTLVCDYCGKELQTQEEANKQKEVWGDLPPEIRTKFESQYQIDQARFHRIIKYFGIECRI